MLATPFGLVPCEEKETSTVMTMTFGTFVSVLNFLCPLHLWFVAYYNFNTYFCPVTFLSRFVRD